MSDTNCTAMGSNWTKPKKLSSKLEGTFNYRVDAPPESSTCYSEKWTTVQAWEDRGSPSRLTSVDDPKDHGCREVFHLWGEISGHTNMEGFPLNLRVSRPPPKRNFLQLKFPGSSCSRAGQVISLGEFGDLAVQTTSSSLFQGKQ